LEENYSTVGIALLDFLGRLRVFCLGEDLLGDLEICLEAVLRGPELAGRSTEGGRRTSKRSQMRAATPRVSRTESAATLIESVLA
jgi:hypothetical protein